jgi:hypothetical protein
MTNPRRRLKKLEGVFTDPMGLIPHSAKWLKYWDRQYYLLLSGQDENATRRSSVVEYRAVMKYGEESPDSLVEVLGRPREREGGGAVRMIITANVKRRLERLEELALPPAIQHVITVTYVNVDGSPTGEGYRIEGPLPNGDFRRTSLGLRQEDHFVG